MKSWIIFFLCIIGFFAVIIHYSEEPKCYTHKTLREIQPQHATRVCITYISQCNDTIVSSEHWSAVIKFQNGTFDMHDYLSGKKPYGKIKH